MAFSTKIEGNHYLQGNVQVYNVRIPEKGGEGGENSSIPLAGDSSKDVRAMASELAICASLTRTRARSRVAAEAERPEGRA